MSNNSAVFCDPRLGNEGCPASTWAESAHILWSVFLVAFLTSLVMVLGKILKRFYKQGSLKNFGSFLTAFFLVAVALRIAYLIIQVTGMGSSVSRPLMLWLFTEPTRWLINGYLVITSVWVFIYKTSRNLKLQEFDPFNSLKIALVPMILLEVVGITAAAYASVNMTQFDTIGETAIQACFYAQAVILIVLAVVLPAFILRLSTRSTAAKKLKAFSIVFLIATLMFVVECILIGSMWKQVVSLSDPSWIALVAIYLFGEFFGVSLSTAFLHSGDIAEGALATKALPMVEVSIGREVTQTGLQHSASTKGGKVAQIRRTSSTLSKLSSHSSKRNTSTSSTSDRAVERSADNTNQSEEPKAEEVNFDDVTIALGEELFLWNFPPKTFADMFIFPNPINESNSRVKTSLTVIYISLHLLLDYYLNMPHFIWYIIAQIFLRCVFASRFSLESIFTVYVVEKIIPMKKVYTAGAPKRAALAFSTAMILAAAIVRYLVGREPANWILGAYIVISGAEALYGVCVMCGAFALLMILGWLPDTVCKQCRMLFSDTPLPENAKKIMNEDMEPEDA